LAEYCQWYNKSERKRRERREISEEKVLFSGGYVKNPSLRKGVNSADW